MNRRSRAQDYERQKKHSGGQSAPVTSQRDNYARPQPNIIPNIARATHGEPRFLICRKTGARGTDATCPTRTFVGPVIPAKAGIYFASHGNRAESKVDSRFRGNDRRPERDMVPNDTTVGARNPVAKSNADVEDVETRRDEIISLEM